ncbi:hypothetical protein LP420_06100 [Massilia sp. B-10]|nr:hypothetical protein LP420_06100 [Massilia sp. B-10]
MKQFNPRAAPPPGLFDSDGPTRETHIMSLPVSVAWKAKFLLIDKVGMAPRCPACTTSIRRTSSE